MKLSLNQQIFIGAGLGVLAGFFLGQTPDDSSLYSSSLYCFTIVGTIFIDLLKMILIPLVFISISVGIANLRAHKQMDSVWKTTLLYYISTTALAVILGLIAVNIFKPGLGLDSENLISTMGKDTSHIAEMTLGAFVQNFLHNIFINPIHAMANGNVLPTVIFALFFGIALVVLGDKTSSLLKIMNEGFKVVMLMVDWIMKVAPFGIAALLAKLIMTQNVEILLSLGKLIGVTIGATLFHGLITLPLILLLVAKRSPLQFFNGMKDALVTAFSTSSSSATLPITIRCVEEELEVDKDVGGFVLPLGATINMDGTAMYEAVAVLFAANLYGIDLNIVQQLIVFLTAIIAAMGAPGIPSAGMVTLVMVLQSVGLPIEVIAILIPIDRPLDALRTTVNVEGDAVGSCVVQKLTSK